MWSCSISTYELICELKAYPTQYIRQGFRTDIRYSSPYSQRRSLDDAVRNMFRVAGEVYICGKEFKTKWKGRRWNETVR